MKHDPDIFTMIDEEADAESHRQGIADLEAGRTISHAAVKRWIESWGTDKRLPRPQIGD